MQRTLMKRDRECCLAEEDEEFAGEKLVVHKRTCSIIRRNAHSIDSTQRPLSQVGEHALPRGHSAKASANRRKARVKSAQKTPR